MASVKLLRMANLDAVVKELQHERDRIDEAIKILTSLNANNPKGSQRGTMSAAARRRISAAQKARWAKKKARGVPGSVRVKRRISPVGIARIRAASKARWARVKAEKKK
jgi:DNA invertase Pin-like site-specific DNA recombinase